MARRHKEHRKHRRPNPRRRRHHMTALQKAFFGPRRHRRHRRHNPRRHYRRHRYSHNPPAIRNLAVDVMYAGAGFMATKIVGNMSAPLLGGFNQPVIRLAIKGGLAYGTAWALSSFVTGRSSFVPVFLGGMTEVVQDVVRTYISPLVPGLSAYDQPMGLYYGAMPLPAGIGAYSGVPGYALGDPDGADMYSDVAT